MIEMTGVREYSEKMPVNLDETKGRLVIRAFNESGYNCTEVDLLDLINWIKKNVPTVLNDELP